MTTTVFSKSRPRRFYLSALIVTTMIIVANFVIHSQSTAEHLAISRRFSESTTLRSQIHTIIFHAGRFVRATSAAERESIRAEFVQSVTETSTLKDAWLNEEYSPEVKALLFGDPSNLAQKLSLFLTDAELLINTEHPSINTNAYKQMIALRPALLDGISTVLDQLRLESDTSLVITQQVEGVLFIVILIALGMELVFIFRPMERETERAEQTLHDQLARNQEVTAALRASETLYRLFVSHMPHTAVVMFDTDARYTMIEGELVNRFPVQREAVGKRAEDVLQEPVRSFLLPIYQRALNGESFAFERSMPEYIYHAYATPLRNDQQQIIGGLVLMHDYTELNQMQAALRASEERLRLITENVHDIIVQTDPQATFTFVSPSVLTQAGYEPDKLIGKNSYLFIHPDDQPIVAAQMKALVANHARHGIFEYQARLADGQYRWHEATTNFLYDDRGELIGAVTTSRDITERKRLLDLTLEQERLQTVLQKEQELSQLKTLMMRGINHEFRTPLAVIQTATEMMTHYWERLTPEGRETKSARVQSEIRRITTMLDALQLVVSGALAADKMVFSSTDLSAICREVARRLEAELKLPGKFVLDLPASGMVCADRDSLREAVYHVMMNAVQFSLPASPVHVSMDVHNEQIDLSVKDTGIGIPVSDQKHIFEPFFRGSNIGEIRGLGLGLTIVRLAVEANHGSIHVASDPNHGTTVNLQFPVNPSLLN